MLIATKLLIVSMFLQWKELENVYIFKDQVPFTFKITYIYIHKYIYKNKYTNI